MRASLTIVLFALTACHARSSSTFPQAPSPVPLSDVPEPEPEPSSEQERLPTLPMLRGPYLERTDYNYEDNPAIFKRVVYVFEGVTVAARYVMVFEPEGSASESTTKICAATVRVPVKWTEDGFIVAHDATAESQAKVYRRAETQVEGQDHDYTANWNRGSTSCSIIIRGGYYRLDSVSEGKDMDRPRQIEFVHEDDRIILGATDPDDERDELYRAIEGHFGREPNLP